MILRLPYRWPVVALACSAYFLGNVVGALFSGDRDDALVPNAVTAIALSAVTVFMVRRFPGGFGTRLRLALTCLGLLVFVLLAVGVSGVDPASATVPGAWVCAAFVAPAPPGDR